MLSLVLLLLTTLVVANNNLYIEFSNLAGVYNVNTSLICPNIPDLDPSWCDSYPLLVYSNGNRLFAVTQKLPSNYDTTPTKEQMTQILIDNAELHPELSVTYVTRDETSMLSLIWINLIYVFVLIMMYIIRQEMPPLESKEATSKS